jgi:3-phenylpropionate/trans-cinnamate dioxygenase ferredoxin reductase subunit
MGAPIVIVGAGQAATSFISRHLALGSEQPLLLIGEESHPPYQRPPLSKKYLLGQLELERLFIRPGDNEQVLSIWYYASDQLLAIDAMNDPKAYAFGRKIIETGKNPSNETVADPATDLKPIAKG